MNILNMKQPRSNFELIALDIMEFKRIEDDAKASRLAAETKLLAMMEAKDEGTVHEEDGSVKVSVTYKLTRTLDTAKVQEDWNTIPELVKDAFTWKPDLVLKHMRALESANPQAYAVLAQYVTAKPAKPAVKVEVI
jgi:hypothetical protein